MKKFTNDFTLVEVGSLPDSCMKLILQSPSNLPIINPGQFVEVQTPDSSKTFLRRPISIHDVDYTKNRLILLVKTVGEGTKSLSNLSIGSTLNLVYPLGNGFDVSNVKHPLLIAGGVGIAPMMYLGKSLKQNDVEVNFLFGAKSSSGLLLEDEFRKVGNLYCTTEDGSAGTQGFVTQHAEIEKLGIDYDSVFVCGPIQMMKAVSNIVKQKDVTCYVSLENTMACGIGACLCCVTDTVSGHKCVCTEGPVFDIKDLKW